MDQNVTVLTFITESMMENKFLKFKKISYVFSKNRKNFAQINDKLTGKFFSIYFQFT